MPRIYRGANEKWRKDSSTLTDGTQALASTLHQEKLTIIALGPLTNIATLIMKYPNVVSNIKEIVAVAGNRPDKRRFFLGDSRIVHFHDLNFRKDPRAFDVVLKSGIPLVLLPCEAATKVTIHRSDLDLLSKVGGAAQWLSLTSENWFRFWAKKLKKDGFHPFDCLAVGYVIMPSLFTSETIPARIKWRKSIFFRRDALEVSHDIRDASTVTYCFDVEPRFKKNLIARLTGDTSILTETTR